MLISTAMDSPVSFNRMGLKFDKARLIGIIRNEVRERNRRESDFGECRRQKKPVDPAERANQQMHGVSNLATSLSALADVTDVDYMETVGAVTSRWTPSSI
ncbi:hypothetical protein GN244_ATG02934 [Phytophthora infestans]|uniref:Uncharacterized protein n=1 Tax=Phytophthora infestans TaxID=4787 RepID=A0A833WLH6_PHYIN|nr:hypothetical protein GN244_ATG02934 [Phytophthora infestans]